MPIENYFKPRVVDPYQSDNSLFYRIIDEHGNIISDAAKLELVNSIQPGNEGTPVSTMALNDMIEKILKQVVSPLILDDNWIPCDGRRIDADTYPKLAKIMPARSIEPWSVAGFPAFLMDVSLSLYRTIPTSLSTAHEMTLVTGWQHSNIRIPVRSGKRSSATHRE